MLKLVVDKESTDEEVLLEQLREAWGIYQHNISQGQSPAVALKVARQMPDWNQILEDQLLVLGLVAVSQKILKILEEGR